MNKNKERDNELKIVEKWCVRISAVLTVGLLGYLVLQIYPHSFFA